jgi:hypothetical protein
MCWLQWKTDVMPAGLGVASAIGRKDTMTIKRKIIQIQALRFEGTPAYEGAEPSQETELIALCDDGSVWTRINTNSGTPWVRVEDIPQE